MINKRKTWCIQIILKFGEVVKIWFQQLDMNSLFYFIKDKNKIKDWKNKTQRLVGEKFASVED